jgi:hypothetical protein
MKIEVRNIFTGELQFEADVDCDESDHIHKKIEHVFEWALSNEEGRGIIRNSLLKKSHVFEIYPDDPEDRKETGSLCMICTESNKDTIHIGFIQDNICGDIKLVKNR